MTDKKKLRLTLEMDVEIDREEYPELTENEIEDGIFLRDSDDIDGFEITTDISGLDHTTDFFLRNGKISKKEWVSFEQKAYSENTIGLSDKRKAEIIDNFLGWMIEYHKNDEDLYFTLKNVIGMTKEELNEFDIESLDEYYEKEQEKAKEETLETLIAEDVVEQTAYALNTPKGVTESEQAKNMLGMIGANIMDESIYEETDYEKEVEESIVAEFKDFKIDKTAGRTTGEVFDDAYEISVKTALKDAVCEGDFEDNVYKALLQNRGEILQKLYDVYQGTPSASVATNTDAESFVEWYAEKYLKATMQEPIKMGM